MNYKIYYDDVFLKHRSFTYHPENPERLKMVIEGLKEKGLWKNIVKPEKAEVEDLLKVHSSDYVEFIREYCEREEYIDSDTYACKDSWDSALTAFGCAMQAVKNAFEEKGLHLALVRPPGHHAGRSGIALGAPSLGFCLFNNVAGGAVVAKEFGKVVIIDFDVHHGNGTQDIFWNDADVVHIDFHEYGIYPGSGSVYDTGKDGSKVNIALPHHCNDDDYIFAWNEVVEPILDEIKPKVVLVSAGFDAFKNDGLAMMELTEKFYTFAGSMLRRFSVMAILEGGYTVGLKRGVPAFVEGYLNGYDVGDVKPNESVVEVVKELKNVRKDYWNF